MVVAAAALAGRGRERLVTYIEIFCTWAVCTRTVNGKEERKRGLGIFQYRKRKFTIFYVQRGE